MSERGVTRAERDRRILALLAEGYSQRAVAKMMGIAKSTLFYALSPAGAKQASRQWKARNRAHVREYDRVYDADRRKRPEMPYDRFLRELRGQVAKIAGPD